MHWYSVYQYRVIKAYLQAYTGVRIATLGYALQQLEKEHTTINAIARELLYNEFAGGSTYSVYQLV